MNGSPKFVLEIEERAGTAIARSEQGVVGVVLFDSTKDTEKHVYASRGDVLQTDWDNDNYNLLKDLAFVGSPYKVIVRRVKEDARDSVKITDILSDLENDVDSIVIPKATESETDDLISYAKSRHNTELGKLALDFNQAHFFTFVASDKVPDHHAIINNGITGAVVNGHEYSDKEFALAIASLEAGCPISRSITNMKMGFLEKCDVPAEPGKITKKGKIAVSVQRDDSGISYYVINRGVTSFITPDTKKQRRFSKVKVVRSLFIITEDLKKSWNDYKGARLNGYLNKMAFLNAVNAYTQSLMNQGILDPDYSNTFDIDIEQHKLYLMTEKGISRDEVDKMSEARLRRINTVDVVYAKCDELMPLDCMEDFYGKAIIQS